MITKAPSFVTSDNQTFLTLEGAQGHELTRLWEEDEQAAKGVGEVPAWVWKNREKIVEILTLKGTSRPRARKANGATKKKRKAVAAAPEPTGTGKE